MTHPDRKTAPKLESFKNISIPDVEIDYLTNRIPVKIVKGCSQPVINITLVINRGTYVADKPFIASATANLISEGTSKHPGNTFPELLDYYGISVTANTTLYDTRITVRTLTRYYDVAIDLLQEMALEPEFSNNNFLIEKQQSAEGLKIANQKVNYLAHKAFLKLLFGSRHRYSRLNTLETLKKVTLQEVITYHKSNYQPQNFTFYLAGDIPKNAVLKLNDTFGTLGFHNQELINYVKPPLIKRHYHFSPKEDAKQSALFMGTRLVGMMHNDYAAINFLNVVLGGYFGSRLMTRLREKMGITYGINSYIIPRKDACELYITSEVKAEATAKALKAINEEIAKLQHKLVNKSELQNVKNYMMGSYVNMLDSSFSVTNQLLTLDYAGCTIEAFNKNIEAVNNMTSKSVLQAANDYLAPTKMVCSIAGKE